MAKARLGRTVRSLSRRIIAFQSKDVFCCRDLPKEFVHFSNNLTLSSRPGSIGFQCRQYLLRFAIGGHDRMNVVGADVEGPQCPVAFLTGVSNAALDSTSLSGMEFYRRPF